MCEAVSVNDGVARSHEKCNTTEAGVGGTACRAVTPSLSAGKVDGYEFLGVKRRGMAQQASDDILGGTEQSNDSYRVLTLCCVLHIRGLI